MRYRGNPWLLVDEGEKLSAMMTFRSQEDMQTQEKKAMPVPEET